MHTNITDFVTDVSDSIYGNWSRVSKLIQNRYPQMTAADLSAIDGSIIELRRAMIERCGVSEKSVETELRKFAHKGDHIKPNSEVLRSLQQYWSELTPADIGQIGGRRTNLVSLLTCRYALSRQHAWQQVNSFFARKSNYS